MLKPQRAMISDYSLMLRRKSDLALDILRRGTGGIFFGIGERRLIRLALAQGQWTLHAMNARGQTTI